MKALSTIRIRGRHDQLAPWQPPSLFVNGSPDEAVNVDVCKRLCERLVENLPISGAGGESLTPPQELFAEQPPWLIGSGTSLSAHMKRRVRLIGR